MSQLLTRTYPTGNVNNCLLQSGSGGLVSDWINGAANDGLLLSNTTECSTYFGCPFVFFPVRSGFQDNGLGDFDNIGLKGAGLALVIDYKGPALPLNTVYGYGTNPPRPPLNDDQSYVRSYHGYSMLDSGGADWTVASVKGFRTRILWLDNPVERTGLFSYTGWGPDSNGYATSKYPHAFTLSSARSNCLGNGCSEWARGDGSRDGSNFMLFRGSSAAGRELRVHPLPADPQLDQYAVQVATSTALPTPDLAAVNAGGQVYTQTLSIPTDQLVRVFSMPMLANTRASVKMTSRLDDFVYPPGEEKLYLFPPDRSIAAKGTQVKTIASDATQRLVVTEATAGNWAMVLDLPGDATAFKRATYMADPNDLVPRIRTQHITIVVRICPRSAIITETGCAIVSKPNALQSPANAPQLWLKAGSYWMFSPAGFSASGSSICNNTTFNGKVYAPLITWQGVMSRLVVIGGRVCIDVSQNYLTTPAVIELGIDPPDTIEPRFEIGTGLAGYYTGPNASGTLEVSTSGGVPSSMSDILADYDRKSLDYSTISIVMAPNGDVGQQYAAYSTRFSRQLQTVDGVKDQQFTLSWRVQAEGYAGWDESPSGTGPLNVTLAPLNQIANAPFASMTYRFKYGAAGDWEMRYDLAAHTFTDVRNNSGIIIHNAKLGGAWTRVDYVIGAFGQGAGGGNGLASCAMFCGDIRATDDTWAAPKRTWRMPDVLINQTPKTVTVSESGALSVFSSDHPDAKPQDASPQDATNVGFSFKTFNANVTIDEMPCPGVGGPPVQVIKGVAKLGLPGLSSDTDESTMVTSSFTLCESQLREVTLTLNVAEPGIPVAQPPALYVTLIGGIVTINPDFATIKVNVGFYVGEPAAQPKPYKGVGTLTLDTRGLFDMQAKGRILGMMDGDGHLWVAWNPLDLGMGAEGWLPGRDNWVMHGQLYAHIWRGSGWQNRYPWLAGDDRVHLTASYKAEFKIKQGQIFETFLFDLPPDDTTIGVELQFGQFCGNASCTAYQWGIKGKVVILGFDVGVYINLDCDALNAALVLPPAVLACTSFILGSDGHLLLDQYGPGGPPFPQSAGTSGQPDVRAAPQIAGRPIETSPQLVAAPAASQVEQTLDVRQTTGAFLAGLSWARGAPQLTLIRPDGTEITQANAAANGVNVAAKGQAIMFGVPNPQPGAWKARIAGATATDDYHLVFFANKRTPQLAFTAPAGITTVNAATDGATSQLYRIGWTPPADAANLRMTLFYSATNTAALEPTQTAGGVIRENLDPATGFYDWDLSYLGTSDYTVYATLQDARGAAVTPFGEDQYVGVSTSIAQGTLRYRDTAAPPKPGAPRFGTSPMGHLACWAVSPAHDLAAYQLTYRVMDSVYPAGRQIIERVLANVPYAPGAEQCARVFGLSSSDARVVLGGGVSSVDASGNVSGRVDTAAATTTVSGIADAQTPLTIAGVINADRSVTLSWPSSGALYDLFYAREAAAGPWQAGTGATEGASPVRISDAGYGGSTTIHGLALGYWYAFSARQYRRSDYSPAPISNQVWLLVTSGADADGDGIPDDYEAAHGIADASGDADGDGLTNKDEATRGTDPRAPDTDGDGWADGDEVNYSTDPLNPNSFPQLDPADLTKVVPLPRLGLGATALSFAAYRLDPRPQRKTVSVTNGCGGTLAPQLKTDAPWLTATLGAGEIQVRVASGGLAPGVYTGNVIVSDGQAGTAGSPQTVRVTLRVMAGQSPASGGVYFPLVMVRR